MGDSAFAFAPSFTIQAALKKLNRDSWSSGSSISVFPPFKLDREEQQTLDRAKISCEMTDGWTNHHDQHATSPRDGDCGLRANADAFLWFWSLAPADLVDEVVLLLDRSSENKETFFYFSRQLKVSNWVFGLFSGRFGSVWVWRRDG